MRLDGHGVPAARMGDGRLVLPVVVGGGGTQDSYRHGDGGAANQCRTRSCRYRLLIGGGLQSLLFTPPIMQIGHLPVAIYTGYLVTITRWPV